MNSDGYPADILGAMGDIRRQLHAKNNVIIDLETKTEAIERKLRDSTAPNLEKLRELNRVKKAKLAELDASVASKARVRDREMQAHSGAMANLDLLEEKKEEIAQKYHEEKVLSFKNGRDFFVAAQEVYHATIMLGGTLDICSRSDTENASSVADLLKQTEAIKMNVRNKRNRLAAKPSLLNCQRLEQEINKNQVLSMDIDEREERVQLYYKSL